MQKITEERQEVCSVASKIVKLQIHRQCTEDSSDWQIIGFDCNNKSNTCESRCTYKLLMEDF